MPKHGLASRIGYVVVTNVVLALCLLIVACKRSGYSSAIASGRVGIPCVKQFDNLFPKANHSIAYYSGELHQPIWQSSAPMFDRYVVKLEMPIIVSADKTAIASFGEPRFVMVEVSRITERADGTVWIEYDGEYLEFDLLQWQRFVEAGGNLSAFGIVPSLAPVVGFDSHWKDA
jgi:hypothetical protein